jgi:hypothetical protein
MHCGPGNIQQVGNVGSSVKSEKPASAIYFAVSSKENMVHGYAWRIWWGGTSFYIKGRSSALAAFKISLHGPDLARPELRPGFKIALDEKAVPTAEAAGAVYCGSVAMSPQWFSGRKVQHGVKHVLTFRATWDLFIKNAPSAPNPGDLRAGAVGLVIPPPRRLGAADVDIYVSDTKPYWPRASTARRDNACIGPIRSKAGQYLTGVSIRRPALNGDAPPALFAMKASPTAERVRGIGTGVDDRGVLWIAEQWMSPSALTDAVAYQDQLTESDSKPVLSASSTSEGSRPDA